MDQELDYLFQRLRLAGQGTPGQAMFPLPNLSGSVTVNAKAAWEIALLDLAAPFAIMKFTLHYEGELPASGNKSKPEDVWRIRNELHPQLADLWTSHPTLSRLNATKVPRDSRVVTFMATGGTARNMPVSLGGIQLGQNEVEKVCTPIAHGNNGYIPLVRQSLGLACDLDIVFLRKGDPGATISQGGDLDNRIKTLFDGLRMPASTEAPNPASGTPVADPLYCLLESDTLIHDFAVRPDRLLNRPNGSEKEVKLVIGVTVKVLNVMIANMALLGD